MLHTPLLWWIATRVPVLFPGRLLHSAALHATAVGDYRAAERLFERAAARYRSRLEVEALASLRVQQLIARLRAAVGTAREGELEIEVEQRLSRLEWIGSLEPPFAPVPASQLLGSVRVSPRERASRGSRAAA